MWVYRESLTIEYESAPLSQYAITYQPDQVHLRTVKPTQLFESPFRSPQLSLWDVGAVTWFQVRRLPDYIRQSPHPPHQEPACAQLVLFA